MADPKDEAPDFDTVVKIAPMLRGFTVLCDVPRELGAVTKFEERNGRIVAKTASGIDLIVPRIVPKQSTFCRKVSPSDVV